jgi:TrkA-C domain
VTGVVVLVVVIALSLLVMRVAAVMLAITGMSREAARFQARSAFTGVGFTTAEAESVVSHPVRRRIVLTLMLVGGAGVVTAVGTLAISFGAGSEHQRIVRGLLLIGALVVLLLIGRSQVVDGAITAATVKLMRAGGLDVRDYAGLLQLSSGYRVGELEVETDDWLAHRTLDEMRLRDEGVVVLGIHRPDASYVGVPAPSTRIDPGDTLVLYGHERRLDELDRRKQGTAGDEAHDAALEARRREADRDAEEKAPAGGARSASP